MKIPYTTLMPIITGENYFEPAEIGPCAIVADVHDGDGHAIDQVAWYFDQPGRWWVRTGIAIFLGEPEIAKARWRRSTLLIHETPFAWINASCNGACVLDWGADLYPQLMGLSDLRCVSKTLGNRLRENLARPRINVDIVQGDRHAA